MKKKIFSTLLMGAFFLASMSMFTSCKDYDDDINAANDKIAALQTQLAALDAAQKQCKADCEAAHANFATKSALASLEGEVGKKASQEALNALSEEVAKMATQQALNEAIEAVNQAIAKKADQSAVDEVIAKVNAIDPQLNTINGKLTSLEEAIAAAQGNIALQQEAIAALQDAVKELPVMPEILKKANKEDLDAAVNRIQTLETELANAKTEIAKKTTMAEVKAEMNKLDESIMAKVNAEISVLRVLIDKKLKSLVFQAKEYTGGIETLVAPELYDYRTLAILAGPDKTLNTEDDIIQRNLKDNSKAYNASSNPYIQANVFPWAHARYHANPSNADLSGYEYEFFTNWITTRAGDFDLGIIDTENVTLKDGIVDVPFKLYNTVEEHEAFWGSEANGWKTAFWDNMPDEANAINLALQATKNDTTVTSDYAVLDVRAYEHLILADATLDAQADCDNEELYNHYPITFAASKALAVDDNTVHAVKFDGSIDLKSLVNVHYDAHSEAAGWYWDQSTDGHYIYDEIMPEDIFESLGLKYVFTPIDYTLGSNGTSESQHIEIINDVAYPRNVDKTGKMVPGVVGKEGIIGKLPIIRVDLVATTDNNKILCSQFIKLVIVRDAEDIKIQEFTLTEDAYMNCVGTSALTWPEVENDLYTYLSMSKGDFEAQYVPYYWSAQTGYDFDEANYADGNAFPGVAVSTLGFYENIPLTTFVQVGDKKFVTTDEYNRAVWKEATEKYTKTADQQKYFNANASHEYGKVQLVVNENDPTTTVLQHTYVNYDNIKNYIGLNDDGTTKKDIVTWVRFDKRSATIDGEGAVYVKLTIPAGKVHTAAGTIGTKIASYWYDLNNGVAKTGFKEIHATAGDPDATSPAVDVRRAFTYNIASTFEKPNAQTANAPVFKVDEVKVNKVNMFADWDNAEIELTYTYPQSGVNAAFSASKNKVEGGSDHNNTWSVKGWTGAEYLLEVASDKKAINVIAIKNDKGKWIANTARDQRVVYFTDNYVSQYANNEIAKDILNYAKHDKMGSLETFTAYVEANLTEEALAELCYAPIFRDRFFNIRYVRPITISGKAGKSIVDAAGDQKVNLNDFIEFIDWRDKWGNTYYEYYGVTVNYDLDGVRSDISNPGAALASDNLEAIGKLPLLSEKTDLIRLVESAGSSPITYSYDATTKKLTVSNAEIIYRHNESSVGEFNLYVPLSVTYLWGVETQNIYAVITVKKTQGGGNAAKKN